MTGAKNCGTGAGGFQEGNHCQPKPKPGAGGWLNSVVQAIFAALVAEARGKPTAMAYQTNKDMRYRHGPPAGQADLAHLARAKKAGGVAVVVRKEPQTAVFPGVVPVRTAIVDVHAGKPLGSRDNPSSAPADSPASRLGQVPGAKNYVVGGGSQATTYPEGGKFVAALHYRKDDGSVATDTYRYKTAEQAEKRASAWAKDAARRNTDTVRQVVKDPSKYDPTDHNSGDPNYVTTFRTIDDPADGKAAIPPAGGPAMTLEHKSVDFQLKCLDDDADGGSFEGFGAVANNIDSVGDIIAPGAFKDAIAKFLQDGVIGGLNHNWDRPIGHPVEAKETPEGLWVKAVFHDTPEAQAVRAMMKVHPRSGRATIRKLSIGYGVPKGGSARLKGPDEIKSYWRSVGYAPTAEDEAMAQAHREVRLLKSLHLHEISPVVVPANQRATVAGAKSLDDGPESRPSFGDTSREVESMIGGYVHRAERLQGTRVKEGRALSTTRRSEIESVCSALESGVGRLRKLLDDTLPPEKSAAATPPGPEAAMVPQAPSDHQAKAARVDPAEALACYTRFMDTRHLVLLGEVAGDSA